MVDYTDVIMRRQRLLLPNGERRQVVDGVAELRARTVGRCGSVADRRHKAEQLADMLLDPVQAPAAAAELSPVPPHIPGRWWDGRAGRAVAAGSGEPVLLTSGQAADIIGCSMDAVSKMATRGLLLAVGPGGRRGARVRRYPLVFVLDVKGGYFRQPNPPRGWKLRI